MESHNKSIEADVSERFASLSRQAGFFSGSSRTPGKEVTSSDAEAVLRRVSELADKVNKLTSISKSDSVNQALKTLVSCSREIRDITFLKAATQPTEYVAEKQEIKSNIGFGF